MNPMARFLVSVTAPVFLSTSLPAATLSVDLQVPVATHMAWALDLAVDGSGNMYVLGRNAEDTAYAVFKYSPAGLLSSTVGLGTLYAPARIAVTESGRIVVSEICHEPETQCRAAVHVFSNAGSLERTIVPARGTITQLASLGGQRIVAATQYLDETFHFDVRTFDVETGAILSDKVGAISSVGVSALNIQKALEEDNCLRDVYVENSGVANRMVAGYSGANRYRILDHEGNTISTVNLGHSVPRALGSSAQGTEVEIQGIATDQGRIYNPDTTCGFYSGFGIDESGNTVVTGRGMASGSYVSEVYGPTGTPLGALLSPYELNYTLAFRNGKAFGICSTGSNTWSLFRFTIQ